MAIQMGSSGRSSMSDINITPMIDVLLVLLVIFMIAQPLLERSIDVQVPVDQSTPAPAAPPIVLEITPQGYKINTEAVPRGQLEQRLLQIYANRPDKILFVKASDDVLYQDVIAAMDAARGAGVKVLGAMLPRQTS
jgi:biopolymer transport protein TolR